MKSIQQRLSAGLIGALVVAGLLLAQLGIWGFDRGLRAYLEDNLQDEAQELLAALVKSQEGVALDPARLSPSFQRPFSGHYFRIDTAAQTLRSRSLWDSEFERPQALGLQAQLGDGPQDQRLLVYRADYRRHGQPISVSVAQDYTPILHSFRRIQWAGLGLGALVLLLIVLAQRITVRRALRPLEQVRQQLEQLQRGQRSELDTQAPRELEPLVAQINHLQSHTQDTLKRSRDALGNLGHALKTPLAVLISLSARNELREHPEVAQTLREQLQNIEQRLARELGRARLAGEALPSAWFDCAKELPNLFETLHMIHPRRLELSWQAPTELLIKRDREDVLELLGNLLDNACKWAQSTVQLTLEQQGKMLVIAIDDDGPGISPERRQSVLERGTRLDEQVAGHGLGLGIVRDIASAWGAQLQLKDSPLGGLRVELTLAAG